MPLNREQLAVARTGLFSKMVSENSKGEIVFDHYHVSLSLNYFEKSEVWKNFTVNPIGTAKRLSCCKIEDGTMIRAFDCSRTSIQFSRTQVCEHMRAYRFYRRDYTVQLENEYILPERFKPLRFAFGNFVFITEKDFFFFFQEADSLLLFEFFLQCILCPLLPFFPELIREDLL